MITALRHLRGPATGQRRLAIVDIVAFVILAVGAGITTGIALMGVVMLLSGSAQAQTITDLGFGDLRVMKASEARQGTLLLKSMQLGKTLEVPVIDTEVEIGISGPIVRARVRQVFRNPFDDWQEGIYVFPLPEDAAVDHLKMRIGERVIEGDIKEKAQAQQIYQQARDNGQRAALVEQERPNLFTTSVANIAPKSEIVIEIEYQQNLRFDGGLYRLRFPMAITPRYIPGSPSAAGEVATGGAAGQGWAKNTDQVPDASRITPPVFPPAAAGKLSPGETGAHEAAAATLRNPVRLHVELDAGVALAELMSSYHQVKVTRPDQRHARIDLADGQVAADRDFELVWRPAAGQEPQSALLVEVGKAGKDGAGAMTAHGLLMVMPPAANVAVPALPRETIFVIDTSGSMDGQSIEQARDALEMAVGRLKPTDRFNIIEFNSVANALFSDAVPASADNLKRAVAYVRGLSATGGTEMALALNLALNGREDPRRVRQVIFLTDGAVGNEDALFQLIDNKLGDSRLFTVGIGSAPNSWFMTKAASAGRGTFTYIGKVEEVKEKMGELFAKLESPVLKGINVAWPAGVEAWPKRLPDLYLGEPLIVSVAFDKPVHSVDVGGMMGDRPWRQTVSAQLASANAGLGVLWARRKIEALLDEQRSGKSEEEIRPQVVDVALAHHLVSKYTSLVAVDKTPVRPVDAALKGGALPGNLPAGENHAAIFGELPRGATDLRWHLLIGSLAMAVALMLRRRSVPFAI